MTVQFAALFLLILCCIGLFLFERTKTTFQETTIDFMKSTSRQLSQKIDEHLKMAEASASNVISNWSLQSILNGQEKHLYYRQAQQLTSIMKGASSASTNLSAIQIYSPQFGYIGYNNSVLQPYEITDAVFAMTDERKVPFERMEWLVSKETIGQYPYIYGIRQMTNFIGEKKLGYVMMLLNINELYNEFRRMNSDSQGELLLYDGKGNLIAGGSSMKPEAVHYYFKRIQSIASGSYLIDDSQYGEYLITQHAVNDSKWHTVVILPAAVLNQKMSYMKEIWIWASLLAIITIFACSWLLSLRISLPIRRMQRAMKRVEKGDLNQVLPPTGIKEINELGNSFNRMSNEINRLINQVYEVEILHQQAELRELQAQINPHFLYNTLDSVYWMLIDKDEEEAAKIIISLSKLFRYTISSKRETVTVSEEFEHIKNYMYVQQQRFTKIKMSCWTAPEAAHFPLLKLTIQPLVENAIYHGLESRSDGGSVTVSAVSGGADYGVVLRVADDGAGMSEERLALLRASLGKQSADSGGLNKSMALENIYKRIKLYYGEAGTMQIESEPGRGTNVTIRLPYPQKQQGEGTQ